jgi:chromosome segregation ATPase
MVENISLTKYQVETLESIADLLESIDYSKEGAEIKFLTLIVNIESLLPKSNIFDYVFKTDITKDKKLELQEIKKQKFEVINSNVEFLKSLPSDIEFKWNQVKENYNIIKENEEKYNTEIDNLYDKIKEMQDELYGKIDEFEKEKNDIVNKTYDEIKSIESNIQDIHTQMSEMASENDVLYGEIENIDFEISQIDNYIEESEWKVDLDSHEEVTFNKIKEKLIIEKKFNYGNI